jgi:hypothetical protein
MEILEENQQFILIPSEDGFDLRRFLGICHKYLEHMERLELNVLAFITEEVHHHLKVGIVRNIACHDVEVGTVQKYLAKKFEGLPLRYIIGRQNERRERVEESIVVLVQVLCDHRFMPREGFLEACVCVCGNSKCCCLDEMRVFVEPMNRVQSMASTRRMTWIKRTARNIRESCIMVRGEAFRGGSYQC